MATTAERRQGLTGEHRFFLVTAWILAVLVPGGFLLNLATGRSSLELPPIYHIHAFAFFGWVVIYTAQATLAANGQLTLHRKLGRIAFLWIPLMFVLGMLLTLATLRLRGGPPFFAQDEFLVINTFHLASFAALAIAAIRLRHRPDWHKRLMFAAMVTIGSPGIARLLPLPFLIPFVFPALFMTVSIFPIAGMIMDKRVNGQIHPAWWWGLLLPLAAMSIGEALVSTGFASDWTAAYVAGTPGGERPPGAFIPSGM